MHKPMKVSVTKKVTVKLPKVPGAAKHKAKSASPHMRMRHLSPMGHSAFGTPPGQSGGPAFPPAGGAPDAGAPPMAFGAGAPATGDLGPGGNAPMPGGM